MSPEYRGKITIKLKDVINDPAGIAIQAGLAQEGNPTLSVRLGKYIEVITEAPNKKAAQLVFDATLRENSSPVLHTVIVESSRIPKRRRS